VAGVTVGLQGLPFPAAALAALPLVLSLRLCPVAFAAAGWLLAASASALPEHPGPGPVLVGGRIVSVPDRWGDRLGFRLRTSEGEVLEAFGPPAEWPLALGDRVRMEAELRIPPGPRNPGGRDAARRLAASGVALRAHAVGPIVRIASPSPAARLERARERFAEAANRSLPPREAALVRAIGMGDRAALDTATTTSFARSGLAHVLAVSGFHLVVVAFGLERVLRFLLLRADAVAARMDPRRVSSAVVLPVALVYALATGGGVPVLRAALAAAVAFAGALLDRETSTENVLALAALALLSADPGAALDPSLQLSFAAVAGLALWAGPLRRALPVRRAAAVATEQEMVARVSEMRARVVEAEAQIPIAIAAAFQKGHLGIMDYYRIKNVQADTTMRENIASEGPDASGASSAKK
jgi:competence protein ComEC